jgi:hypothetical protein
MESNMAFRSLKRAPDRSKRGGGSNVVALVGNGTLHPGQSDTYDTVLRAGYTYDINVKTQEHGVDFDVYVLDENGNAVAGDDDIAADAFCAITPRWTGPFKIIVKSSRGSSGYSLIIT